MRSGNKECTRLLPGIKIEILELQLTVGIKQPWQCILPDNIRRASGHFSQKTKCKQQVPELSVSKIRSQVQKLFFVTLPKSKR